ncbi:hypothetical protein D3C81_2139610 [compost metagenome]
MDQLEGPEVSPRSYTLYWLNVFLEKSSVYPKDSVKLAVTFPVTAALLMALMSAVE